MAEIIVKKKKSSKHPSSKEDLQVLDKNDLINKIIQLEAHIFQLKNIIKKTNCHSNTPSSAAKARKPFNFSDSNVRHILLKFYYFGWNYSGFVEQEDTTNTVEHEIFNALKRSCLIECREKSNYHRCGRTDKGVSAFSQVISINVRSKLSHDEKDDVKKELPYCKMLNRILPRDIQCTAWAPADEGYSARFDCVKRTYKYFFPKGNLSIDAMKEAAKYLVGTHDFRNICKMDVANGVVNFQRTIDDVRIISPDTSNNLPDSGYDMCQLVITSKAFLWHQIRCIMGILLLIGEGKEQPNILLHLFDINNCPSKPQYNLAHELPLNLYNCEYDNINWFYDNDELITVIKSLHEEWTVNAVKAEMIKSMADELKTHVIDNIGLKFQNNCLIQGVQMKTHQPLLKRVTCESLENRIKHFEKKQKIDVEYSTDNDKNIES